MERVAVQRSSKCLLVVGLSEQFDITLIARVVLDWVVVLGTEVVSDL